MIALRGVSGQLLLVLLLLATLIAGDKVCDICECAKGEKADTLESVICQTQNRSLFEDDLQWPKEVTRINVIEFRDMISAVLPIFKCDKEVGVIMFERSNLKGVDKKALSELPRVESFSFAENSIEQLSPDTFDNNQRLLRLNFSSNKLETLPGGLFDHHSDLIAIDLSCNKVQILSSEFINTVKHISTVDLRRNSIFAIDQVDMENVKIGALDLSENNLRFLKSKQFQSFTLLWKLNLSHNNLKDIQDDAFLGLDSLLYLDLSNNHLHLIDLILPNLVKDVILRNNVLAAWPIKESPSRLITLDLHNNTLDNIHIPGTRTVQIEKLIVSRNQLESFPSRRFSHVKALDLSFNRFEVIPEALGDDLESLEMTGNPIQTLAFTAQITVGRLVFREMPLLTTIEAKSFENVTGRSSSLEFEPFVDLTISHCPLLTTIEAGAFEGLIFNDLDLSYNKIERFPETLTNWTAVTGVVDLQGNPLSCHCADEWMVKEILGKLYKDPKLQYLLENLRCSTPLERAGKRMVHFYSHHSPFCKTETSMRLRKKNEGESVAQSAGFNFGDIFSSNRRGPSAWLVVAVCAFTITCLVVMGIILQRDVNRRKRDSMRRMLFSDL